MSIRYCLKCKSIFEDSKSLFINNYYFCMSCKEPLIYFGREAVDLSEQSILDAYDILHPYQPEKDFTGIYKSYGSVDINRGVLECEDTLKKIPYDRDALFYLSRYYWNLNDVKKCWRFFSVLLEHYDLQFKEAEFYIDYLLYVKDYQTMLEFLTNCKDNYNDFFVLHYQGVANLALGNYKKALLYFYQSLSFCTDSIRETKIKEIIKKINSYIENT